MITGQTLLFATIGGILPTLLWLWFWLREDKKRPEPRGLIVLSFLAGMIMVPIVIPIEQFIKTIVGNFTYATTAMIVLWATTEELLKFLVGFFLVLRRKANDEPIDAIIYMITIALGFAAVENTLFLIGPLFDGDVLVSIMTGNLRFLGATLLHTLASAVVGAAMALSFYKVPVVKKMYLIVGLTLAVVLHSLFNFFIIITDGEKLLAVFFFVWVGIVFLLLTFEKVKKIYNRDLI